MLSAHDIRELAPKAPSDLTRVSAGYAAPDGWHAVYIELDERGRWKVFDGSTTHLVLVETLTGHDDRLDQAEALAVDYAAEQTAYHAGRRESPPLPRPQVVTVGSSPPHNWAPSEPSRQSATRFCWRQAPNGSSANSPPR
jgi:hypothetical protein